MNHSTTRARVRGCFASHVHRSVTKSHLIESASVHWRDAARPSLTVWTRCGLWLGAIQPVRTGMELPAVHDLCDDCILADFLPPFELYRFFDISGAVLYVGQTANFLNRLRTHYTCSPWWSEVDRWTREPFNTLAEVLDAEVAAIRADAPRYNRQHNPARAPKARAA